MRGLLEPRQHAPGTAPRLQAGERSPGAGQPAGGRGALPVHRRLQGEGGSRAPGEPGHTQRPYLAWRCASGASLSKTRSASQRRWISRSIFFRKPTLAVPLRSCEAERRLSGLSGLPGPQGASTSTCPAPATPGNPRQPPVTPRQPPSAPPRRGQPGPGRARTAAGLPRLRPGPAAPHPARSPPWRRKQEEGPGGTASPRDAPGPYQVRRGRGGWRPLRPFRPRGGGALRL